MIKTSLKNFSFFFEGDIAIGQIKNYQPDPNIEYPKFKNPKNLEIGTSLCKLGFPLYDIKTTFDESSSRFIFANNTFPLPFFPIEGIFTRNININNETNKSKFKIKFLETSSPGLRGQSGGPIFDRNGIVWAVQSRTQHFPLGFKPAIVVNGKKEEENQFLNAGGGIHSELIFDFLTEHKVKFEISD